MTVIDADRFYLKAVEFHGDVAEALGTIVDYQKDLNRIGVPDKNRTRTNPLFEKYEAPQEDHPFNTWNGPNGIV